MSGQVVRSFAQSAEVDDLFKTARGRGICEVTRRLPVAFLEITFATGHRVHEVKRGLTARQRRAKRFTIKHVAGQNLDLLAPAPARDLVRITRQTTDPISFGYKLRD